MMSGIIAIVIQGSLQVGGLSEVMRIAQDGGRINFKEWVIIGNVHGWLLLIDVPLLRAAKDSFATQRFSDVIHKSFFRHILAEK